MTAFAILRVAKLKSLAAIRGAAGHNARSRLTENVDPARTRENRVWRNGGPDAGQSVMNRIAAANIKPRRNAVLAMEMLLSASPDFFRPSRVGHAGAWDRERLEAWAAATQAWLKKTYGDRVIDARLHLDESSPHAQVLLVPLTSDGKRLSARDVFSRTRLRELQTEYARALATLGIQRGIAGSKATHTAVSRFYAAAIEPLPPMPSPIKAVSVEVPPLLLTEKARQDWAAQQTAKARRFADAETQQQRRRTRPMEEKGKLAGMAMKKIRELEKTVMAVACERHRALEAARKAEADLLRDTSLDRILGAYGLEAGADSRWKGAGHNIKTDGRRWFDDGGVTPANGKGAIDLVKHLLGATYEQALGWLRDRVGLEPAAQAHAAAAVESAVEAVKAAPKYEFGLPEPEPGTWSKAREYLVEKRGLAPAAIDDLHSRGLVYSDGRANAVFVMRGRQGRALGAELRGTSQRPGAKAFHGCVGGTDKNNSAFLLKNGRGTARRIVLVEAAIDALSYRQTHPEGDYIVASTVGRRGTLPDWLKAALRGSAPVEVVIAFDNDRYGNESAAKLTAALREIDIAAHREVPPNSAKDWNDALISPKPAELARPGVARDASELRTARLAKRHPCGVALDADIKQGPSGPGF
jgi:hypothetical protein